MKIEKVNFNIYNNQSALKFDKNNKTTSNKSVSLPNYNQVQTLVPVSFGKVDKKEIKALVGQRILPKEALSELTRRGELNPNVVSDLKKLKLAKRRNVDPSDIFVPEFNTDREALSSLGVGDTYKIYGDKNIKIVDKDFTPYELALSKEKYMELFPPAKRFCVSQSSRIGNCWFLSALDTMYTNPKTRKDILSVFKENRDGTVDVNFGGYVTIYGKAFQKDDFEETIRGAEIRKSFQTHTPYGFAIIENAYEARCAYRAGLNIQEMRQEFINNMNSKIPMINGYRYSKEEMKEFLLDTRFYKNDCCELAKLYVDPKIKGDSEILYKKEVRALYNYLNSTFISKKYTQDEIVQMKRILLRHYMHMCKHNEAYDEINDIVPLELYLKYMTSEKKVEKYKKFPYNSGGFSSDAFKLFNMEAKDYKAREDKNLIAHLLQERRVNSKYLITAGLEEGHEVNKLGFNLIGCHEYSILPVDVNGTRKFLVKNPHNASHAIPLSLNEVLKYFDDFTFAKIPK